MTKVCCESGRFIFNVSDHCLHPQEKQDEYKRDVFFCTIEPKYCSCKEFLDQVVCNKEILLVK